MLCGATLVAATLLAGPGWPPAYDAVVRRYAAGERETAVAEIVSWPESRLGEVRALANGVAAQLPLGPRCLGPDCSPVPLQAALMLHTDAASQLRASGASPKLHEQLAIELVRTMTLERAATSGGGAGATSDAAALRSFAERWFLAVALQAQSETRFDDALAWAERGLKVFPRSADLQLVVGSVEETLALLASAPEENDGLSDLKERRFQQEVRTSRERRLHLQRAREAMRSAVASAPERAELSVRLARVAWKLGDAAAARAAGETALARAPAGPTAYLAHLFLGRLQQDSGGLEEAARSYQAAVALQPQCQAARVALSHVRLLLGESAAARRDLEAALAPAWRRDRSDPFWDYPWGESASAPARLTALRQEASR